ncbi:MAG TPA: hypothetical protein VND91_08220 [Candidatus Saccharimonadia bacterium]|nr:hypothetical protein [Candidatus Saccharimonadia bacterium]
MARTLLGVFAGLVVMLVVIAALEAAGHALFPPPPGVDYGDPEQLRRVMELLSPAALAAVLVGWVAGAALGACTAAAIAREHRLSAAMSIGVVMLLLVVANLVMLPHPWWIAIGSVLLPLPSAWLGYRLAR